MVVRAEVLVGLRLALDLEAIRWFPDEEEGQLLHGDVALSGELYRHGRLANESLVGQILARPGDAAEVEVSPEVVFEFGT